MQTYTNIQSSAPTVKAVDINVDTVYIRSNITDIHTEEMPVLWQYDEIQMTVSEYLKKVVPENQNIADMALVELSMVFAEYMAKADAEIAELKGMVKNV